MCGRSFDQICGRHRDQTLRRQLLRPRPIARRRFGQQPIGNVATLLDRLSHSFRSRVFRARLLDFGRSEPIIATPLVSIGSANAGAGGFAGSVGVGAASEIAPPWIKIQVRFEGAIPPNLEGKGVDPGESGCMVRRRLGGETSTSGAECGGTGGIAVGTSAIEARRSTGAVPRQPRFRSSAGSRGGRRNAKSSGGVAVTGGVGRGGEESARPPREGECEHARRPLANDFPNAVPRADIGPFRPLRLALLPARHLVVVRSGAGRGGGVVNSNRSVESSRSRGPEGEAGGRISSREIVEVVGAGVL